jgi:hypothetical protein
MFGILFLSLLLILSANGLLFAGQEQEAPNSANDEASLKKKSEPKDPFSGLTDAEREAIRKEVTDKILRTELRGSRYRIFGIQATPIKTDQGLRRYAYTLIYDYTRNKTYNVVFDTTRRTPGKFVETLVPSVQPPPNHEEYEEAKKIVASLDRVQQLTKKPNVVIQESFPVDSPPPCDVSRCVEIQVNEVVPREKQHFCFL